MGRNGNTDGMEKDVVEARHPELTQILNRVVSLSMRHDVTYRNCFECNQHMRENMCEACEQSFMAAQDARRDVIKFVDKNYQPKA